MQPSACALCCSALCHPVKLRALQSSMCCMKAAHRASQSPAPLQCMEHSTSRSASRPTGRWTALHGRADHSHGPSMCCLHGCMLQSVHVGSRAVLVRSSLCRTWRRADGTVLCPSDQSLALTVTHHRCQAAYTAPYAHSEHRWWSALCSMPPRRGVQHPLRQYTEACQGHTPLSALWNIRVRSSRLSIP